MKTQQADSLGRDAALRDPRIGLPSRTAQGAVPTIWLNLVCLDAPLVAVAWLWLFARSFGVAVQIGNAVALFLTAWFIYLADRFADASTLKPGLPQSLRQQFCLRHREIWIATVALVAGFDAYVIWQTTAWETFLVGAIVGLLAVGYLVVNQPLGLIWRALPAKEIAIGALFAAGTVVALLPHLPSVPTFPIAVVTFAALCSLNCIGIAAWERELDRAQGKVSIVTLQPAIIGWVGRLCFCLALGSLALAVLCRSAAQFFLCLSVSATLLGYLNASGRFKGVGASDRRTALADLVLLSPVLSLIWAAL